MHQYRTQRTQNHAEDAKEKFKIGFFCAFCESFAPFAFGCSTSDISSKISL